MNAPAMVNLYEEGGDVELWLLKDVGIQMPVLVTPGVNPQNGKAMWLVTAAMPMTQAQNDWLIRRMQDVTSRRSGHYWIVNADRGVQVFKKAPGITPKYYMKWGGLAAPSPAKVVVGHDYDVKDADGEFSAEVNAFTLYVANRMSYGNLTFLRKMWCDFMRCAANWMIIEGRPLDMRFAYLRAFPYRKNWEQIIAAKFPGFLEYAKMTAEERVARLEASNLKAHLALPEMAAMHSAQIFEWTVNVEVKPEFHEHARKVELIEYDRLNPAAYYERWKRIVSALYSSALSTMASFFLQASWPNGDVDKGLPHDRRSLRWLLRPGRVRPAPPDVPPTEYCLGEGPIDSEVHRKGKAANPPTFDLPSMPDEDLKLDVRPSGGVG